MKSLNVLVIQRLGAADHARIKAIDPAINLVDAGGWFDGEYRETWPAYSAARYLSPNSTGQGTREERDKLLAETEVILGGWPFPLDLRARAPRLKWFHQRPAGASNLLIGDLWGSDVMVTTSRGAGNTLAMAEYAVAGILHFAKGLDRAITDRDAGKFDHRAYRPLLIQGKTACVVGAGGIGLDVGRLCAALGMRVVGTRRTPPDDHCAKLRTRRPADSTLSLRTRFRCDSQWAEHPPCSKRTVSFDEGQRACRQRRRARSSMRRRRRRPRRGPFAVAGPMSASSSISPARRGLIPGADHPALSAR
jgi:hypothetical protein